MGGPNNSGDGHKLGLRSPRSPSAGELEWQKLQFFDHEPKGNLDNELGKFYYLFKLV